jgi:hypothetical protein
MFGSRAPVFAISIVVGTVVASEAPASAIVDSVNASSPLAAGASWGVPEAGFAYTPSFSYTLDGIATQFGSNGCYNPPCYSQTVTIAIYLGLPEGGPIPAFDAPPAPPAPPANITLLGSGTIIPVPNTFVTASISPVALSAGTTYFVAFENINNIYVNMTDSGPVSTGEYYDETGNQSFNIGPNNTAAPGWGFETEFFGSAVPEPSTWTMMILGFLGLGWNRRKNKALRTFRSPSRAALSAI